MEIRYRQHMQLYQGKWVKKVNITLYFWICICVCVYVCVRYCNPDHKKTISYITAFLFLIYFSGLWGLVNNAGMWYVAEIEMTPERVFRRALDVNLFGMIRVTKTFLPLIRRGRGRIVNMSSVTGNLYNPFLSDCSNSLANFHCIIYCYTQFVLSWSTVKIMYFILSFVVIIQHKYNPVYLSYWNQ